MKNEFLNKNIFISGGSNSIGYEIAKHFLKKKANIFILGRKNNFKKSKKLNFYRFDVLNNYLLYYVLLCDLQVIQVKLITSNFKRF